jgi:hypothetical protein
MVVVIKRSDSVSVLSGQVGPTDRDIWQFRIETLTVDLLIPLVQVHVVDGFTRVSVASAEKNYRDGNCGDRDLEEAAHLKRVAGVSFGRNSTDVLFEWAAKNSVLMGSRMWAERYGMNRVACRKLGQLQFLLPPRFQSTWRARSASG